jgi:hypothetical protein
MPKEYDMTNSTDALPAVKLNDRATSAPEPNNNDLSGQLLIDPRSNELVDSMKASGASNSSKFLAPLEFSYGDKPSAPRDIPFAEYDYVPSRGEKSGTNSDTKGGIDSRPAVREKVENSSSSSTKETTQEAQAKMDNRTD